MDADMVTYDEMDREHRDLVDNLQEEHEDFTEELAVQAVNELGIDANDSKLYHKIVIIWITRFWLCAYLDLTCCF